MNTIPATQGAAPIAAARSLLFAITLASLASCGGGGGGGEGSTERPEGVYTGFSSSGNLDWTLPTGEGGGDSGVGVGAGADGDGGVGAGGDFGQFRNALLVVKYPDGSPVGNGQALTDPGSGMVTIKPRKGYLGPLYLELRGGADASYFEEGKDAFVPFPTGQVIRTWIPRIDKNIGITPFTETAYRLLTEGSTPEKAAAAVPTAPEIRAANDKVRSLLNRQFPAVLAVDDITRLPFIKSPSAAGQITNNPRGIYGLVNGAFSKQAAMFNPGEPAPTLAAIAQLSTDLLDGKLDGLRDALPAVAAGRRTYDPNTLTGELTSALAEQSERFGTQDARGLLPRVLNFGSARHEGYLFDTSLKPGGEAVTTVAGWVSEDRLGRSVGTESPRKLPGRVFGVYGNLGHGGVFLKANAANSQAKLYGFGDNIAGELGDGTTGLGTRASAGDAVEISLPTTSVVTHVAGGFAHTVARMADGSVYTWGDNSYSQLGQGVGSAGLVRAETPVKVTLPLPAISVAASNTASYALLEDGRVFSWGSSWGFGLLGDGVKDSVRNSPAAVQAPGGDLSEVVQIVARDNDVIVTRRDGTVWTWGSFPSEAPFAYTDGDVSGAYRGGSPLPTKINGLDLQPGVQVRKILAEQGLFVVLTDDGAVYTWGVHFDITAQAVLRDLSAVQVLGLPKVRDLMPGGFVGYGSRPFDRLTSMAIDYRGNLWKVRGRVAERYDPDRPTETHRPTTQGPRSDCASCHVVLTDWPLQAPVATNPNECVPPAAVHGDALNLLINSKTECTLCHNPARKTVTLPNGWLNCKHPVLPPPRPAEPAASGVQACKVSANHVFTPPGAACSACHNSVIARPLRSLAPPCSPPDQPPAIATTVTITAALNDANVNIAAGSATTDTTPVLAGTLGAALSGAQSLVLRRNGNVVGKAAVQGTAWTYADSGAGNGTQTYVARVEEGSGFFGAASNAYSLVIDTVAPTLTAGITGVLGDGIAIAEGHATSDTTPTVEGVLSAAPAAGEFVQLQRNGMPTGAGAGVSVAGTAWTFTEPAALAAGRYAYTARVVDAAGNLGAMSTARSVIVNTTLPTPTITTALNDSGVAIAPGASTTDTTPALQGSLSAALLPGQSVKVLRNGVALAGSATLTGASNTGWTYTDPGAADGTHAYTARADQGALTGAPSAGYVIVVDTTAPSISPAITAVIDEFLGVVPDGGRSTDDTPVVTGSLPAALGAGETLQLWRDATVLSGATLSFTTPTSWTFQEGALTSGATYTYTARVVDAAGNAGAFGAGRSVIIDTSQRTATITAAFNDSVVPNLLIANGAATSDTSPVLEGTLATALISGQSLVVRRNAAPVGNAVVTGGGWRFTDSGATNGAQTYTVRVESGANTFGPASNAYVVVIDSIAPAVTVSVTGIQGDGVAINNGWTTSDTTPTVTGTLSAAAGTGEFVQLLRNGVALAASASLSGTAWTFTEPVALAVGTYAYAARVVDAAGNLGTLSSSWSVIVNTSVTTAKIITAVNDSGKSDVTIVSGASTNDTTPRLHGTIGAALLPGQAVNVLRNGVVLGGSAKLSGTEWVYTDPGAPDAAHTYTARVVQGTLLGDPSAGYVIVVDSVAPTIPVAITNIYGGDFAIADGAATNDTTPTLVGEIKGAPGAGEFVQILRNGAPLSAHAVVTGAAWTFTEPAALAEATYAYSARVVDEAGNAGPLGSSRSVIVNTSLPGTRIATAYDTKNVEIASGGFTYDTTLRFSGTIDAALLPGQVVKIYRDGAVLKDNTSVDGRVWSHTDTILTAGAYTYTARVVQGSLPGALSAGYVIRANCPCKP